MQTLSRGKRGKVGQWVKRNSYILRNWCANHSKWLINLAIHTLTYTTDNKISISTVYIYDNSEISHIHILCGLSEISSKRHLFNAVKVFFLFPIKVTINSIGCYSLSAIEHIVLSRFHILTEYSKWGKVEHYCSTLPQ